MDKELVMYVGGNFCAFTALARDLLQRYEIPYREININDDPEIAARIKEWTHHYSVPTLIVAHPGQDVPYTDFLARPTHRTIKGYDRGPMITEPNNHQLENWLHKHGFLDKPYKR